MTQKLCIHLHLFLCVQFCGRRDELCERLVCHLGNLEVGREADIQLEIRLNPAVLLQAPVTHTHH